MASDVEARVIKCFSLVFPELAADEIETASRQTLRRWDSLASVTLFAVLEEEFNIKLVPEDFVILSSFNDIREHVRFRVGG
ncbi:MAG: acyl carrier protein [bacterium]